MKRRITALLLSAVLLAASFPTALAAKGDISFTYDEDTATLTITGSGPMDEESIYESSTFSGKRLLWEYHKYEAVHLVISPGITSIGDNAFSSYSSITSLGRIGFTALETISIPDSVTSIGSNAFYGCESLPSISIPDSVTSIGSMAFAGCSALEEVEMSSNLQELGNFAFQNADSLEEITLPRSLTQLGKGAFQGCDALRTVTIQGGTDIPERAFESSALTTITLGEGVTTIGKQAFANCKNLTGIRLPDTVTWMEEEAFQGCTSLTEVELSPNAMHIPEKAFQNCTSLTEVVIPEGVRSIGGYAFEYTGLQKVTLPASLSNIGSYAFRNMPLQAVYFAGSESAWNTVAPSTARNNNALLSAEKHFNSGSSSTTEPTTPTQPGTAGLSNFKKSLSYTPGQFADVSENAWYAGGIQTAYELGLVNGTGADTFSPTGNITVASALALACRLHSIYKTGEGTFTQGDPWYQVYVDYAVNNGIITAGQFSDYNANATRAQFAAILAKALPDEALPAVNSVTVLPDVADGASYLPSALLLYNAGILTGSDAAGSFRPDTTIQRSEVATIVTRMADQSLRRTFSLEGQPTVVEEPSLEECFDFLVDYVISKGTVETSGDYKGQYRKYLYPPKTVSTNDNWHYSLYYSPQTGNLTIEGWFYYKISDRIPGSHEVDTLVLTRAGGPYTGSHYKTSYSIGGDDVERELTVEPGTFTRTSPTAIQTFRDSAIVGLLTIDQTILKPAGYSIRSLGFTQLK